MTHLYVCHFSNGHIKVGRSITPRSRIASHADRVACMGVELVDYAVFECVGSCAVAELQLIEQCRELAAVNHKSEWFGGLDFDTACALAQAAADFETSNQETGIQRALALFDNSPTKLASAIGLGVLRQHVEHWVKSGRVPPDRAPRLEALCGFKVRLWDLCPTTWHLIWPDLRHAPGAPDITKSAETQNDLES